MAAYDPSIAYTNQGSIRGSLILPCENPETIIGGKKQERGSN